MKKYSLTGLLLVALAIGTTACSHRAESVSADTAGIVDTVETMEVGEEWPLVTTEEELLALQPEEIYGPMFEDQELTPHAAQALALANRVVTMYVSVDYAEPDNVWMWAEATDKVVRQYADEHGVRYDIAVRDLHEALVYLEYDAHSQWSMNTNEQYLTVIRTYDVVMAYRQLIDRIADRELKRLVRAEYNAWFKWFDAEYFTFVYGVHGADSYSMLPLEYGEFHSYQTDNRLAALRTEQKVLTQGKIYRQRGTTVTGKQWRDWLDAQGYREGMSPDFNLDEPTATHFPALLKDKTERWLAARQAVATYLGDKQGPGQSYDALTADIHACIVGRLKPPVPRREI